MDLKFDESYWTKRWENGETGWDIGHVSTPIKTYFDQLEDKSQRILIPGAGNAYEAEYLFNQGFNQVWIIDISEKAIEKFLKRVPNFPKEQAVCGDFFQHEMGQFDIMVEQTFFCAIDPSERTNYIKRASEIIRPGGKLVGLLFQVPLFDEHPPFGGNSADYRSLFQDSFNIEVMETAYNSIKPRMNSELFIRMLKP